MEKYQISGSYEAIKIAKENLKEDVQKLIDQGFKGFNVTIPHKEEIFKLCDFKSKSAAIRIAVGITSFVDCPMLT